MIHDHTQFAQGIIRLYRLPFEATADYQYWWLPEVNCRRQVVRPARMSARDKARYLEVEGHNLVTNQGRTSLLQFIGAQNTGGTWAQYLGIGNAASASVSQLDTTMQGEFFRIAVSGTSAVSGTQVDFTLQLGTSDATGTFTNMGLWGNGASATLGSGQLHTHALFSYTKGSYPISIDYIIDLF